MGGHDPKQSTMVEIENQPDPKDRARVANLSTNAVEKLTTAKFQDRKSQTGSILLDADVVMEWDRDRSRKHPEKLINVSKHEQARRHLSDTRRHKSFCHAGHGRCGSCAADADMRRGGAPSHDGHRMAILQRNGRPDRYLDHQGVR